jgi:hypothetical protein
LHRWLPNRNHYHVLVVPNAIARIRFLYHFFDIDNSTSQWNKERVILQSFINAWETSKLHPCYLMTGDLKSFKVQEGHKLSITHVSGELNWSASLHDKPGICHQRGRLIRSTDQLDPSYALRRGTNDFRFRLSRNNFDSLYIYITR